MDPKRTKCPRKHLPRRASDDQKEHPQLEKDFEPRLQTSQQTKSLLIDDRNPESRCLFSFVFFFESMIYCRSAVAIDYISKNKSKKEKGRRKSAKRYGGFIVFQKRKEKKRNETKTVKKQKKKTISLTSPYLLPPTSVACHQQHSPFCTTSPSSSKKKILTLLSPPFLFFHRYPTIKIWLTPRTTNNNDKKKKTL